MRTHDARSWHFPCTLARSRALVIQMQRVHTAERPLTLETDAQAASSNRAKHTPERRVPLHIVMLPMARVRAAIHCMVRHGASPMVHYRAGAVTGVSCPVCGRSFWRRSRRGLRRSQYQNAGA
jgi:hypothetical protein